MELSTELFDRMAAVTEWDDTVNYVFFYEDHSAGHVYILYMDGMDQLCHKVLSDYFWVELKAVEQQSIGIVQ